MRTLLRRLPLRWRLSLAFAAVMAVILGATGLFVYVQLRENLDEGVTEGLRTRFDAVARLAASADGAQAASTLEPDADSAAQVIDASGRVLLASPPSASRPLVDRRTLRAALASEQVTEVTGPSGDAFRVVAGRTGADRVALVAESLEDRRDEPLRLVAGLLLIGLPIALVLATLAGSRVARAALRPVEELRREAERITGERADRRLPVAPGDDELARLGHTLNAMLGRIDGALGRQRAFVADAAHELRTPLSILAAETELALRHAGSDAEYRAALHANREEIDRLSALTDDLLVLARADTEAVAMRDPAGVEVAPLLEAMAALFRARSAGAGRAVRVAQVAPGLRVAAERHAVERAVTALVDNALRHGAGPVELGATARASRVRLAVRDHGPGIDPVLLPVVFERFTRGDAARSRGGTGLGLSIVAATATRFGGDTGAANHRDGGVEVWLTLPQAPGAGAPRRSGG